MTKRKAEEEAEAVLDVDSSQSSKKAKTTTSAAASEGLSIESSFAAGLFTSENRDSHRAAYVASEPYKHAVIQPLIADSLLRGVLEEIRTLHFTEKTTDIYRIWQSGDLANLDGLDAAALAALPSLRALRDALYSEEFRGVLSQVTGSGPLSGKRTDMAVNIYRPGCYLLCHDDVIGTRRVSYILYLTEKWQPKWGGALRLYATENRTRKNGETVKVPIEHHEEHHAIPPAWNQLSFFAVQPGESYHDVEEVYVPDTDEDGDRIRVAISGWFHLPQEDEPGYIAGMEAQLQQTSSLAQLQRSDHEMDCPQPRPIPYSSMGEGDNELSAEDLEFLVQFISPQHLTPEAVEWMEQMLGDEGSAVLPCFLNKTTATRLGEAIQASPADLPRNMRGDKHWHVAGPPHKQRFVFQTLSEAEEGSVWADLHRLFVSTAFRTWLQLGTGTSLRSVETLLRRFRRGYDYQLAQNYTADEPRLEATLGLTPGKSQREEGKWWDPEDEDEDEHEDEGGQSDAPPTNGTSTDIDTSHSKGKAISAENAANGATGTKDTSHEAVEAGGEEIYMAAEAEGEADDAAGTSNSKPKTHDPAVYRSTTGTGTAGAMEHNEAEDNEDDEGILHANPPSWNTLGIVLRDKNVLRAVRYRNRHALGDRWDWSLGWEVDDDGEDGEDEEEE